MTVPILIMTLFTMTFCAQTVLKVVSTRFESEQPAMSGYVKIGKANKPQWKIKLHYGKARLFVKSETPEKVKISAVIK